MKSIRTKTCGMEFEAFSKRARRLIRWHRGETAYIKRQFWRKLRARNRSRGIEAD